MWMLRCWRVWAVELGLQEGRVRKRDGECAGLGRAMLEGMGSK